MWSVRLVWAISQTDDGTPRRRVEPQTFVAPPVHSLAGSTLSRPLLLSGFYGLDTWISSWFSEPSILSWPVNLSSPISEFTRCPDSGSNSAKEGLLLIHFGVSSPSNSTLNVGSPHFTRSLISLAAVPILSLMTPPTTTSSVGHGSPSAVNSSPFLHVAA